MKKRYRNVAFLTELLINILIFSISCAILVGLFSQASIIARKTREESFAGTETYALVQTVTARGMNGIEGCEKRSDGTMVCYYNEKWAQVDAGESFQYKIEIFVSPEETGAGTLHGITAVCQLAEGEEIYRLETAVYEPTEGGAA